MGKVEIKKERYERLLEKEEFLESLEIAGVDNWNGYSFAHEDYEERMGKEFY